MQTSKRKRKDCVPVDDILRLIQLVRENPAIYNYKLQPHRRRVDVLLGWTQIAAQIGNKYTVEECRRKWKNLRDTYHQYRLRKSKPGDGLSKWRYAKDLEFLSNVYQPKLKSERKQHFNDNPQILQGTSCNSDTATQNSDEILSAHHGEITLVNHDAETFILTAYEESVNDVAIDNHELHTTNPHEDDLVEHIVKNEHPTSLSDDVVDDDGATGAEEVDYEEVCLYEEATNAPVNDCVINHGSNSSSCIPQETRETKEFHYIDANDFCIDAIDAHTQLHNCPSNNSSGSTIITGTATGGNKLKNIMNVVGTSAMETNEITTITTTEAMECMSTPLIQFQTPMTNTTNFVNENVREELDLFFDFLKKKIQHFSKEEISAIQIDILNCVLRREAESSQKFTNSGGSRN